MNPAQFINKGLLGEPALLLGFIAFLGLLLQKQPVQRLANGTIKTMLGYTLLQIGAAAAGSSLSNLSAIIQNGFQIIGIIPHNETITALAQINYGEEIALIMLFGMALHLVIARFTPIKYVFLTGHHMLFMASMLAGLLMSMALPLWQTVLMGATVLAAAISLGPFIAQPYVRKTTGDDQFAIGHFNSIGYVLSGWIASWFRPGSEPPEPAKLQKLRAFFQDHMSVITVFTFGLFLVSGLFTPSNRMEEMFSGRHFIVVSLIQATWFAGGCYIILAGVRMMLSEIIPAFKGIADRFVPGAIPALDCPVLFKYSPFAAMFGFFLSFAGGIVAMIVLLQFQYTVIIPGVIPHFFSGGAASVIAYKTGGRTGMIAASLIHGFVITMLPVLLIPLLSNLGFLRATFADSDFSVIGVAVHSIVRLFY
ncbi:PTS ascorbate transporter subunit IIC [Paenibacillus melissococcoides]|uniref:Ascorbate-specific PTS system EIIC component n=1 Tax=Paenibacillus melissococcoides TaxID=2912268 RepID=A0ABM9FZB1_9BACL|nr:MULTISPECIES: PTS ascorbate transporter subunit IIC [Paenibacillus]MEB9892039.1 PTS ascorbate transporter subunit IIC [Bacillus cereus]CAH8244659.1 PTS ascorbate transporter subunit IIC [Paenibacillus melissococcoides]CAH8708628.1 PTS ascorbate transporter subunit IIC [Paenibacillus melissococcoides]CAH8709347.1 PTS ascorbate transporter subunit IIC [Paenibacillus melissococcoides]GIO77397.1 PTS ascorbate transporter subunit IIC [Paenibacillus dendritiformis]